jgi:hypothetical protein
MRALHVVKKFTFYPDEESEDKNVFDLNVTQYFVSISCLAVKKDIVFLNEELVNF